MHIMVSLHQGQWVTMAHVAHFEGSMGVWVTATTEDAETLLQDGEEEKAWGGGEGSLSHIKS